MTIRSIIAVGVSFILLTMGIANAQQVPRCADRPDVIEKLAKDYQEAPTAMGLANNGSVLEVVSSSDGSWTILITNPEGTTCLVAAGEGWSAVPRIVVKAGRDS